MFIYQQLLLWLHSSIATSMGKKNAIFVVAQAVFQYPTVLKKILGRPAPADAVYREAHLSGFVSHVLKISINPVLRWEGEGKGDLEVSHGDTDNASLCQGFAMGQEWVEQVIEFQRTW